MARIAIWSRKRSMDMTRDEAIAWLARTDRWTGILSIGFCAWAVAFLPYVDALTRSHIAFFLAISMFGCVVCIMHLRSAPLILVSIVSAAFGGLAISTGDPTLMAMAVNVVLVTVAILSVVLVQSRDFVRMVNAQSDATTLLREQGRLLRMIDDMPVAVMTVDPVTFKIGYVNETSKRTLSRIEDLLPIKANELLGASIDIFHKHPEHQRRLLSDPANLPHSARIKLGPEVLDLKITAVNGSDGSYIGPMLTWSIVTKEVEAENRIYRLARYDTLTGLANRNTFHEQLEASIVGPDSRVGLLFIDLDGFKIINDTKGHHVGDALLTQVADRLRAECGQPDMTIGRLGGDEFAILQQGGDPEGVAALAGALVDALSAPYRLDPDRRLQVGASIGVALAPLHGDSAEALRSRADIALYAAKAAGKRTFRLFSFEMEARIQERVRLDTMLRAALEEQDGLFVFYQPIVNLGTNKVTAREALIRWHDSQRGWIPPCEFIPVAEESGLIDRLGLFVLDRACRDAAEWADGARVAVNVSPSQLGKGTLASTVLAVLTASGLSPSRLEIEVTESVLLSSELDSIADLRGARALGVRVALDDFGTGFSSLAHLRAFPFDKIKIDGSFVKDAVKRPDCAAVVKAVADLGRRLGVITVAEGVETQAHLDLVIEEGCCEVQGYYFGRPMPSERDAPIVDRLNRMMREPSAA
jgi:diguanylate cyclase (GGDEF)-like protein